MQNGVCLLSLIPIRFEPTSKSEMVSQLLFGETYEILDQQSDWIKIKTETENYEGWISQNQYCTWNEQSESRQVLGVFPYAVATNKVSNLEVNILPGSVVHDLDVKEQEVYFQINNVRYSLAISPDELMAIGSKTIGQYACKFLNAPYLWGGKSMWGIDCSGLTQLLFKVAGLQLPRDAYQQAEIGDQVDFVNDARLGDLAFFDNEQGKITHVGMVLEPGEIIHASGMVRRDVLDSYGIFNESLGKHTHKLRMIKRIIPSIL
ncbi:MAG: hydrolase Nlp/P60 [Bacteroidetes bacterium B1(2017)]|nr:MAG: hydrolase Nlp/P60 [Bacteroidetes bacterium B1(2017)]